MTNERHGEQIIKTLFEQCEDELIIIGTMLKAAARNWGTGDK